MNILYINDRRDKSDYVPAANSRTDILLKSCIDLVLTMRQGFTDFKNTFSRTILGSKLGGADLAQRPLLNVKNHVPFNFKRQNGHDHICTRTVFKRNP